MTELQEPLVAIESDMSELTDVDQRLTALQAEAEAKIKSIIDGYKPLVDLLTQRRTELVDQITRSFEAHRGELLGDEGKTIVIRSGALSASFGSEAIDIIDESTAMDYARRQGMLRKVTKVGKRTFVKSALKQHPDFVAKCPGLTMRRTEFLHIKLVKTQVEIKQDLAPYRRAIPS